VEFAEAHQKTGKCGAGYFQSYGIAGQIGVEMETLYRLFDDDGQLLYVGISSNWRERFHAHEKNQSWWDLVTNITLERFESREAVAEAERVAIKLERPSKNKQHSQTYESPQDHFDKLKFFIHYDVPVDGPHKALIEEAKALYAFDYFQARGRKTVDVAGILRSIWSRQQDDILCRNCFAVATWGALDRWADIAMSKFRHAEGYEEIW